MFIPETEVAHVSDPPQFHNPEEVIHPSKLALWYRIFIDVIGVEDWHEPSESSAGSNSDSGADDVLGSRVSGFSHP
jgi:hypothetical protein